MSFNKSLEFSLQMEGLYCDEPGDAGGETYRGIARVYHPHWVGWELIDSYKQQLGLSSPVPKQFWKKLLKMAIESKKAFSPKMVKIYGS